MRIYVAGPLNSDAVNYIKNVHRMMKVAIALKKKGHAPYVPCLDVLLGFLAGDWEYADYAEVNLEYVDVCEALFLMAHSPGATREFDRARGQDKIIYTKLEEVPDES